MSTALLKLIVISIVGKKFIDWDGGETVLTPKLPRANTCRQNTEIRNSK
jgi:hypothetical protein